MKTDKITEKIKSTKHKALRFYKYEVQTFNNLLEIK